MPVVPANQAPTLSPISLFADSSAGIPPAKKLSAVFAPFGRLIPCETVITVDSASIQTPIVGLVTENIYYGGKLVIPAGTEIHGTAQTDHQRERIASGNAAPADEPNFRTNPEVDAKIDTHIKENPKYWNYIQAMPRDRLERTVVLNEVRELDRQHRMREGMMKRINANPALKNAYETLVKDLPEDQKEGVIAQIARRARRAVARTQGQQQQRPEGVGV